MLNTSTSTSLLTSQAYSPVVGNARPWTPWRARPVTETSDGGLVNANTHTITNTITKETVTIAFLQYYLTYHRDEGEDADEDGDGQKDKHQGIQFVVAFLNNGLRLQCLSN